MVTTDKCVRCSINSSKRQILLPDQKNDSRDDKKWVGVKHNWLLIFYEVEWSFEHSNLK